jgi:hypothetical protein
VNILLGPTPSGFVKSCIETIRPRSGITPHGFNDSVNLIEIRGRISKISEVWVGQRRGGSGRRGGVWKGRNRGLGNGRSENAFKIGSESVSNLFRGCGMSAVWVGGAGDSIFAVTFENGEMKEICVAITFDCPTFFSLWLAARAGSSSSPPDRPSTKWKMERNNHLSLNYLSVGIKKFQSSRRKRSMQSRGGSIIQDKRGSLH